MATYYVSNAATNGYVVGNDANDGLDPSTPWLTVAKAINNSSSLVGGDIVIINSGTYNETSGASGLQITKDWRSNPVTIKSHTGVAADVIIAPTGSTSTAFRVYNSSTCGGYHFQDVTLQAGGVVGTTKTHTQLLQFFNGTVSGYSFTRCTFQVLAGNSSALVAMQTSSITAIALSSLSFVDCVFDLRGTSSTSARVALLSPYTTATNGVVNGTTTVTSATIGFVAGDVGKDIYITTSVAQYTRTVATYVSGTEITVSGAAIAESEGSVKVALVRGTHAGFVMTGCTLKAPIGVTAECFTGTVTIEDNDFTITNAIALRVGVDSTAFAPPSTAYPGYSIKRNRIWHSNATLSADHCLSIGAGCDSFAFEDNICYSYGATYTYVIKGDNGTIRRNVLTSVCNGVGGAGNENYGLFLKGAQNVQISGNRIYAMNGIATATAGYCVSATVNADAPYFSREVSGISMTRNLFYASPGCHLFSWPAGSDSGPATAFGNVADGDTTDTRSSSTYSASRYGVIGTNHWNYVDPSGSVGGYFGGW